MNEPSYPTTPPDMLPPLDKPKTPILGIISLICAILSGILFCLIFVVAGVFVSQVNPNQLDYQTLGNLGIGVLVLMCGSVVVALAGVGLGIAAVLQKDTSKVFGIIGLVLSAIMLLAECGIFAFSMLSA